RISRARHGALFLPNDGDRSGLRSPRMPTPESSRDPALRQGIRIITPVPGALHTETEAALGWLQTLDLNAYLTTVPDGPNAVHLEPGEGLLALAPQRDTTALCTTLQWDTENRPDDLARESVLVMLFG